MILDAQLMFSDSQAITADARSTNTIDLGVSRGLFEGEPLAVVLCVEVAADATTGDETYAFQLRTDDNTGFASPTTLQTTTIAAAQLGAGSIHILAAPIAANVERYLELYYDVAGTTPTITVSAFLQPLSMIPKQRYYANNSNIAG